MQLDVAGVCGVAVALMVLVRRTPDGSFYRLLKETLIAA